MSTGLTWFFILDVYSAQPDYTSSPIQFSDYSEARSYAEWLMSAWITIHGNAPFMYIYTTSPGQNGYYGGNLTFTPFD